jgi:hypothetical protein
LEDIDSAARRILDDSLSGSTGRGIDRLSARSFGQGSGIYDQLTYRLLGPGPAAGVIGGALSVVRIDEPETAARLTLHESMPIELTGRLMANSQVDLARVITESGERVVVGRAPVEALAQALRRGLAEQVADLAGDPLDAEQRLEAAWERMLSRVGPLVNCYRCTLNPSHESSYPAAPTAGCPWPNHLTPRRPPMRRVHSGPCP